MMSEVPWYVYAGGALLLLLIISHIQKDDRPTEYNDDYGSSSQLLSSFNKGHSISEGRTSLKRAFQHTVIIGQSGFGKTTAFLLKSAFYFAKEKCTLIILDPAMEFFKNVSGLAYQGNKKILRLNFGDSANSEQYNPLSRARTSAELTSLAELLLAPQARNSKDSFWPAAAARLLVTIWKLQKELPSEYYTIANTRLLVTLLTSGNKLDLLFTKYADNQLFEEYKALIQEQRLLNNIAATALTALRPWEDEEVCKVTSGDTISIDELRSTESILFIHPNLFKTHLNVLYEVLFSQMFETFMGSAPDDKSLPLHIIGDELGSFTLKNMDVFLSTARKFRISIQFAIQSRQQIIENYGPNRAHTIFANCYSKVILPNMEADLARELSQRLGRHTFETEKGGKSSRELASVSELVHLKDDSAIYLAGSNRPCIIKIKPFFKNWRMTAWSKIPPPEMPEHSVSEYPLYDIDAFIQSQSV